MSFPDNGAYYTFHLDPVASLQDIEDDEVAEAARRISPQIYIACTIKTIGAPQLPPSYEAATIALVQQGLPPNSPGEFLESRITRVRVRTDCRDEDPPYSLGSPECVTLRYMFQDDEQRRELLRDCAAKGISPPPPAPSDMSLACIDGADRERSDTPYWQILAARRAERLAQPPLQLHVEIDEDWDAETDHSDASEYSDVGSASPGNPPPASGPTHIVNDAHDDVAMDTVPVADNIAEGDNDLLAIFTHRADLGDVSPVIVPLSYDLSTLAAPPSPTGFMEELSAIRKIRANYEERMRRLKEEVRRGDDDYYTAAIEAHRTEGRSAQYKGPVPAMSVPFTAKMRTRLVSLRPRFAWLASKLPSNVKPRENSLLSPFAWRRRA